MFTINDYLQKVNQALITGQAGEHTHRLALEKLMETIEGVHTINEPKRSEYGQPDFAFYKKKSQQIVLGYAETKDIDTNLDLTEETEQMHRYAGYSNLFLSNYIEFRFFKNGEKYKTIKIGDLLDNRIKPCEEKFDALYRELRAFTEATPESIRTGTRLAQIMGGMARRIRDNVFIYLTDTNPGTSDKTKELDRIYKMMKELLVKDLSHSEFADMYAQTLVYGLFVARYNDKTPENFDRFEARDLVPRGNPFLRKFFDHIVGPDFDTRLAYIVNELCEIFAVSNVQELMHEHLSKSNSGSDKDPVVYFYENFLNEYDAILRKNKGAYYTPVSVVRFMIKQVDAVLKEDFGIHKGLADASKREFDYDVGQEYKNKGKKKTSTIKKDLHKVQILDPALGTATFINEIILYILKQYFQGQEGRWGQYVTEDLLPRLHGFELMMAPYTIAHFKLGMTLKATGMSNLDSRIGVYLTNTLEEGIKRQQDLFSFGLAQAVTEESRLAAEVKNNRPVMIVIGNPPYSGESFNKTPFANALVNKYKVEPGGEAKLGETNIKWLSDDYVKFIAFAEDVIRSNGHGIMAMITNHAYLDNPTFRGMRWHLRQTFDKIYILDLHGSSNKREVAPDGGRDQNVFDIKVGVCIIIAVKTEKRRDWPSEILHADIYGTRKHKFETLDSGKIQWQKLDPDKRDCYFVPVDTQDIQEYEDYIPINDLFQIKSAGIVTARDPFTIVFNKQELTERLQDFINIDSETARQKYKLGKDVQDWKVDLARKDIGQQVDENKLVQIDYRPFDKRWTHYTGNSKGFHCRPRDNVMRNYLHGNNIGMMVCRQQKTDSSFSAFIHDGIVESGYVSNRTSEIGYSFPLYVFFEDGSKQANFDPVTLKSLMSNISADFKKEDVFNYIYAVLWSPGYREKYSQRLKRDFPRIPPPKNNRAFQSVKELGAKLVNLHLGRKSIKAQQDITFPMSGDNIVRKVEFGTNQIWLNEDQYFGNVSTEMWNLCIGAYRPAEKWLKDRRGMLLSNQDIEHYQDFLPILHDTTEITGKLRLIEY